MKKFNPDRELYKLKYGKRDKIVLGIFLLLIVATIGSTFALYQVRHSKRIIYTTVDDFSKDIQISLYIDGKKDNNATSFPEKNSGKIFSKIECDNGSTGVFDNANWQLLLKTDKKDKCNVYFVTGNLPNAPELYQGMIPVTFSDTGIMYVADTNSDWYNYQDHRWANAVLVNASNTTIKAKYFDGNNKLRTDIAGIQVPMEDVLQMYVWIPRYKYQLFNVDNKGVAKQLINIAFESGTGKTGTVSCTYTDMKNGIVKEDCKNAANGEWYTHPAFTFGTTELQGFWVGKFEPSDPNDLNGRTTINVISEIAILPGKTSMINRKVQVIFDAEQKINDAGNKYNLKTEEVDTRMMRNMEWGAVAYLTQSVYGIYKDEKTCNIDGTSFEQCEVWNNNTAQGAGTSGVTHTYGGTYTGCVGDKINAGAKWNDDDNTPAKCANGNRWNEKGVRASTTGNMYGIYDMSGGTWEYMMGLITVDGGTELYYNTNSSGFSSANMPDKKYYDVYAFSASYTSHERGHLGDATKETLATFGNGTGGWNADYAYFPHVASGSVTPWFIRGGASYDATHVGVFAFHRAYGGVHWNGSFRSVLSVA